MIAALVALLSSPTTWLVVCGIFLSYLLYQKLFIDIYGDDAKTISYIPFVDWPKLSKITATIEVEHDIVLKHGMLVRMINVFHPSERMIYIADPDVLREIYLGSNWQLFTRGHPWLEQAEIFAGGLILIPNGQHWKEARDLFSRTFTNVQIRTYNPILRQKLEAFMEEVDKAGRTGEVFNIQPMFTHFTFGFIVRLVFGEDLDLRPGSADHKYVKAWDELLTSIGLMALMKRSIGEWSWSLTGFPKMMEESKAVLHSLVDRNIARRERGEDLERSSVFDDAMASGKVPGWMLENNNYDLKKQLMTMLFGGHDTTASLLSFMCGALATRPEWQQAIRDEIKEAFGDEETSLEKLEGLKSLNACVKETLRLWPAAVHGANRSIQEDFDFHWSDSKTGQEKVLRLKKGDFLMPSPYISGRHPANWSKEPDTFNPQRWIDDPQGGALHNFAWVPFGNGQRKCLGEKLAFNEARLVMAELLRKYKVLPAPGWKLTINQASMLNPANVQIRVVPVKKA